VERRNKEKEKQVSLWERDRGTNQNYEMAPANKRDKRGLSWDTTAGGKEASERQESVQTRSRQSRKGGKLTREKGENSEDEEKKMLGRGGEVNDDG